MKRILTLCLAAVALVALAGVAHASGAPAPVTGTLDLLPVLPVLFGMGSINDLIPQDKNTNFTNDTVRAELNKAMKDAVYGYLHRPAWQVAAAAVAPPVCDIATTASKVKTTATSQLFVNGVPLSLTATDDLWSLVADAANVLAVGSVRRYQLCWDGTSATTVVSVRPSNDKVIASYADAATALAACRWPALPPAGTVIVGVLSIVNVTNVFVPGTTLLSAAGVTDTYRDGPDANCFLASPVSP
jgi:hypothetical protein